MRNLLDKEVHRYRVRHPIYGDGDHETGCFMVDPFEPKDPRRNQRTLATPLAVIAAAGMGWDHVSVSLQHRCPTWDEMERVKRLFFLPEETAMQLHVPLANHISVHPYCLHLWRPHEGEIPLPPSIMVG